MDTSSDLTMVERIELLSRIGVILSAEQDIPKLLEMILLGAKKISNADGGSLYILAADQLFFEIIHTTSLGLYMGGTSNQPITFPPIPLHLDDGSENLNMVVTRAALQGRLFNVADSYASSEFDFSGTKAFDAKTGYRSRSFLTVPMKDHEDKVIGVLQLINALDKTNGEIIPFSPEDESLVASLASQAAIVLNRKRLIDNLEELLQSLVKLIANAIDDKSPHTAGHCRRVPPITMALARAINDDKDRFSEDSFSAEELKELELAAWLHDCGKLTTPEYVVDKRTRLETIFDRIHLIEARLEIIRRDLEIEYLQSQLAGRKAETLEPAYLEKDKELDSIMEFLRSCNSAGFLDEEKRKKIAGLSQLTFRMSNSTDLCPLLTDEEKYNLSIPQGTLTAEERKIINDHVDSSIRMLQSLPFPQHMMGIPEIAGGHHERIDGKGYPRGLPARDLSLQSRILAIADIFEALTASDRVYRKPNTLFGALKIMCFMCKDGHIDPDLLTLFITSKAYLDYVKSNLKPEQVDQVDDRALLEIFA